MNTKKIHSANIKGAAEPGEDTVVTINGKEFIASTLNGAVILALDYLEEPAMKENIVEFIEVATKGIPSPKEKRRSKPKLVVADAHILPNEEPGTNLTLNTTLVEVDEKPQTPTFIDTVDTAVGTSTLHSATQQAKVFDEIAEKREFKTPTFVGKLYTDKEGYVVYEVTKETPPTDWQFELRDLRAGRFEPLGVIKMNLKEFKELMELVPKRSMKKEGK